jgi:hypothetical protein
MTYLILYACIGFTFALFGFLINRKPSLWQYLKTVGLFWPVLLLLFLVRTLNRKEPK